MRWRALFAGVVLAALGLGSVSAAGLPQASVQYSAVRIVEAGGEKITSQVYYGGNGKERSETDMGRTKMIMIVRPDKGMAWVVMPSERMYQELDVKHASQHVGVASPDDDVEIQKVGSDTVEGMATTRYKIIRKDRREGGFVWLSKDNIPVKLEVLDDSDGEATKVTVTLKNIKLGKQDPALFELPTGYRRIPAFFSGQ